jgi:hypothetical protein
LIKTARALQSSTFRRKQLVLAKKWADFSVAQMGGVIYGKGPEDRIIEQGEQAPDCSDSPQLSLWD